MIPQFEADASDDLAALGRGERPPLLLDGHGAGDDVFVFLARLESDGRERFAVRGVCRDDVGVRGLVGGDDFEAVEGFAVEELDRIGGARGGGNRIFVESSQVAVELRLGLGDDAEEGELQQRLEMANPGFTTRGWGTAAALPAW